MAPLPLLVALAAAAPLAASDDPPAAVPEHPLAPRHAEWLEEVGPLLWPEERAAFLGLDEGYRRDAFASRFWRLRDPDPNTAVNELREKWERRREEARRRFGDLAGDRALALLIAGPPQRSASVRCPAYLPRLEVWLYDGIEATRGRPWGLVFEHRSGGEDGDSWRLWEGGLGLAGLADGPAAAGLASAELERRIVAGCPGGSELAAAAAGLLDRERLLALRPRPNLAWLQEFRNRSTMLPESAESFPAQIDWRFPGRVGQRITAQSVISIAAGDLTAGDGEHESAFSLLLDGEVVREGRLFESFRYRFQLPSGAVQAGRLPVVFERQLRPGSYRMVLRLEDVHGGRYFRSEQELTVPDQPIAAGAKTAVAGLAATDAAARRGDVQLRLLPPAPRLHTGWLRMTAEIEGEPASVLFRLDGRPVMRKNRSPWSVELDLGDRPRLHRVEAVALDAGGEVVASDEVLVNAGPHRLAVRLVEPQPGSRHVDSLRARAEVEVPLGERLERLEFYLNDRQLATLYQPPFELPVVLPEGEELAYVRAVAWLESGAHHEDLVFVNAPRHLDSIEVQTVELYVTVTDRRGRPVDGLEQTSFRVLEDDREQSVRRFEMVRDLPFWAAVLIDTSQSMVEEVDEATRAALGFFRDVLQPHDRASVFTFADEPRMVAPFTADQARLADSVAEVVAQGETRLYDSLLRALYEFGGLTGKRALIVLTDGEDSASRHDFEDTLEYARHSGVAIYPIGLGLTSRSVAVRSQLLQLAEATGGRAFFVQRALGLDRVYGQIEQEIRSQYLLVYQSDQTSGEDFREVEVEVREPGLSARTIPGYVP